MRLQVLTLALLATTANADTLFDITFNRVATFDIFGNPHSQQFFTGTIVTDGICTICSIDQTPIFNIVSNGLKSIDINGTGGFALGDPAFPNDFGNITLDVATLTLTGSIDDGGLETLSFGLNPNICPPVGPCPSGPGTYFFNGGGAVNEWGGFTVSPEPAAIWLFGAVGALLFRKLSRSSNARPIAREHSASMRQG